MRLIAPKHMLQDIEARAHETVFVWTDELTGQDLHVEVLPDCVFLDRFGPYNAVWLCQEGRCIIRDRGDVTNRRSSLAHEYVHFLQDMHASSSFGQPPKKIRSGSNNHYYLRDHEFYACLVQDFLRMQDAMPLQDPKDTNLCFSYFVGAIGTTELFEGLRRLHGAEALSHMSRVRTLGPSTYMLNLKWHHKAKWRHAIKKLSKYME